MAIGLAAGFFPFSSMAQDRTLFHEATFKRCVAQQRADPVNAERRDLALSGYCTCYAAEISDTVPADILNTSPSAATPEQAGTLQALMEAAAQRCANLLD